MNKKYNLTDYEKQIIINHYDGKTESTDKIMSLLGNRYPRWYIRRFAQLNGLARVAQKRPWSEDEIEYLADHYATKSIKYLCKKLKRSSTAIVLKKRRLGITKSGDGLTMRQVMDILGCDHRKVRRWINLGLLKAQRKNTERTESQGGDMWHIETNDLRNFILNYWEEIDIRRVEKFTFIQIVAGKM